MTRRKCHCRARFLLSLPLHDLSMNDKLAVNDVFKAEIAELVPGLTNEIASLRSQ